MGLDTSGQDSHKPVQKVFGFPRPDAQKGFGLGFRVWNGLDLGLGAFGPFLDSGLVERCIYIYHRVLHCNYNYK